MIFSLLSSSSDNNLWVIDTSSISYSVVSGVYKDSDGTTITYPLTLGTWMRIDRDTLTITKSGLPKLKKVEAKNVTV